MGDFNNTDSVMIALLPTTTDWCHIPLPHMTLVYAGLLKDQKLDAFNELAKIAFGLASDRKPITLKVTGVRIFGGGVDEKVDVLRLRSTPELAEMRRSVESWNASDFPFNPHATIGPTGQMITNVPESLTFDRIMVGWGEQKLVFPLAG